jgi:hypothetical protein
MPRTFLSMIQCSRYRTLNLPQATCPPETTLLKEMHIRVIGCIALLICAAAAAPSFDAMVAINYANPIASWSGSSDCTTSISSSSFMGVNCTMVRPAAVCSPSLSARLNFCLVTFLDYGTSHVPLKVPHRPVQIVFDFTFPNNATMRHNLTMNGKHEPVIRPVARFILGHRTPPPPPPSLARLQLRFYVQQ